MNKDMKVQESKRKTVQDYSSWGQYFGNLKYLK